MCPLYIYIHFFTYTLCLNFCVWDFDMLTWWFSVLTHIHKHESTFWQEKMCFLNKIHFIQTSPSNPKYTRATSRISYVQYQLMCFQKAPFKRHKFSLHLNHFRQCPIPCYTNMKYEYFSTFFYVLKHFWGSTIYWSSFAAVFAQSRLGTRIQFNTITFSLVLLTTLCCTINFIQKCYKVERRHR